MGKSQLFYDRHQIGTNLVGIPEHDNSAGATTVIGLDRERAITEYLNPNVEIVLPCMVSFHDATWDRNSFNKVIYQLHQELRRFRREYGRGWLTWVNTDENTTTTLNNETAGSDVVIDVADVNALGLQVDDYVLLIPPDGLSPLSIEDPAEVAKVKSVGGGDFTVYTLAEDLASGSKVYRVFAAWENAVWKRSDTGAPPEQAADFYRFVTNWEFGIPSDPVLSVST